MASHGVNKVIIIGRVGQDPEVRQMPNGNTVANVSIATSESWNDKSTGEKREVVEWHRVVFYRGLAEVVAKYVKKGSKIYIEGKLRTRKWQDQSGQERYTTEIHADEMQMLDSRQEGQPAQSKPQQQSGGWGQPQQPQGGVGQVQQMGNQPMDFDDIPFS